MRFAVVVSVLAAVLLAGGSPVVAGKREVTLTYGSSSSERGGPTAIEACGLSSRYGRIVVWAPSSTRSVSPDMAPSGGCVSYPYTASEPGVYTAQAYTLSRPGGTPHIVATVDFEA